jgi:hypothetical protein
MRELETKHLLNLSEILQGRNLIAVSAGFSGTPVILSLDRTPDYRAPLGRVKRRSDSINNYRIHYFSGEELKHIELTPTHSNYHDTQPLGVRPMACRERTSIWLLRQERSHLFVLW